MGKNNAFSKPASPSVPENPSIALRPVTPADTEFLIAVYSSTRSAELAATDWSSAQKVQFCTMQFHAQDAHYRLHYPTAQFLVIESGTLAIGRLYIAHWAQEIRIMDIALLPAHRGQGIATHLLRDLQTQAAAADKSLTIHVESFNPARQLYQRLGFRVTEDKGVYQLMEWTALK